MICFRITADKENYLKINKEILELNDCFELIDESNIVLCDSKKNETTILIKFDYNLLEFYEFTIKELSRKYKCDIKYIDSDKKDYCHYYFGKFVDDICPYDMYIMIDNDTEKWEYEWEDYPGFTFSLDYIKSKVIDDFKYAKALSLKQKKDEYIFDEIVCRNGLALKYANEELKNNRKVVLHAVIENGLAIKYASDDLRKDEIVAKMAIDNYIYSFHFIDANLRNNLKKDKKFMICCLDKTYSLYSQLPLSLKKDKDIILKVLNLINKKFFNGENEVDFLKLDNEIKYYFDDIKDNKNFKDMDFMKECIKIIPTFYKYLPNFLKNNKTFLLELLKENKYVIKYVENKFYFDDYEIMLHVLLNNSADFVLASDRLKNDEYLKSLLNKI